MQTVGTSGSMPRFFTYGWQYAEARKADQGVPLRHAAGSQFTRRGISPGDCVYVMAIHDKELYLIGKMRVGKIVGRIEARRILGAEPYDGIEHLIAGAATPAGLTQVPAALARKLRFVSAGGNDRLSFGADDAPSPQALRVIRELEPASAARLDELLDALAPLPADG